MAIDAMMHKSSSAEELVATIGAVSRDTGGDNVVISMPRSLLQRLSEGSSGGLSERETEVLVLAARGLSLQSPHSRRVESLGGAVKRHLANIYENVGVHSRNDAVRKALVEQWIGLHERTSAHTDGHDGSPDGQAR